MKLQDQLALSNHTIFGAGLIGGFIGGVLASLGKKVQLVARPKIKEKLNGGLRLTDYLGNEAKVRLNFLDTENLRTDRLGTHFSDFLWLTVKCTGIEQASKDIFPLVGPNTVILCCQNGLGSEQLIKEHYPKNTVLRAMIPFNVAEPKEGHLHRGSEGDLCIELCDGSSELIEQLTIQINSPLMPVTQSWNMQELLWAKLQLNLSNSINALADIPVKSMLEQRAYRLVIAALMKELLQVTKLQNIKLPKLTVMPASYIPLILRLPNFLFNRIANRMLAIDPTVRTSMWWDLSQGKKTEIDHLNGAIVTAAEKMNIPCPANKNIIALIKQTELSNNRKPRKGISGKTLLQTIAKNV